MLLAALRRFLFLLGMAAGLTALGSIIFGVLAGSSLSRALSLGFYLVGSFLLVAGFFVGNRGPARLRHSRASGDADAAPLFGTRLLRWATPEEREEAINTSAIFVTLGFTLIVMGVLADSRYQLF